MEDSLRSAFPFLAAITWLFVPIYAFAQRGRTFAIFSALVIGISLAGALIVHARLPLWAQEPWLGALDLAFTYGMGAAALHYAHLVRARMRGPLFRALVSTPGQTFIASSLMATVWLVILAVARIPLSFLEPSRALEALAPLDLVPYAVGAIAALTSPGAWLEHVLVRLDGEPPETFRRVAVERARFASASFVEDSGEAMLRIAQISDPHLGPWQSVSQLRARVDELVAQDPDLVLLTGDFLTMESNATPGALATALEPLRALAGRCYAIFGNHDHEAPDEVRAGLAAAGVDLLVDDARETATPVGPVQIVGSDYVRKERRAHLRKLLEEHPRRPGQLRLLLLHDPSGFHDLPDDEVDLVFSGHTHGGQVGLVSLGLDWTVLAGSRWPDHGLFARGKSHLYVHRGTGFYGFPLRIGVPGEHSILQVVWKRPES